MNFRNFLNSKLMRWLRSWRSPGHMVLVKQLQERDRRRMKRHFLALERRDRQLRFGTVLPDAQISAYVENIDFARDTLYGVYGSSFKLLAVGHLAFAPKSSDSEWPAAQGKECVAEFGVSVARSARGMGIGSRLFQRAAIHCRNNDVDSLYMHYLSSNQTMMHIAKKAGMAIVRDHGEADAYLRILPPNPASILKEAVDEQVASLDYRFKANTRAAIKWFEWVSGRKGK